MSDKMQADREDAATDAPDAGDSTRRRLLQTAMLAAPVILTLKSRPALASAGSGGSELN